MTAAHMLRLSRPALACAVIMLWIAGCRDAQAPRDDGHRAPSAEILSTLVVSNPVTSAVAGGAAPSLSGSSTDDGSVYVSLPPGSAPNGEQVVIQTRRTGAEVTTVMIDGGFDPIPVVASTGDTLDIRIEIVGGGDPLEFFTVVPPRRPPVVVRTDPPPGKRDVPLNAVMLVVFSEPIDAATLTASSVQLTLNGAGVAGTLDFGDDANLTATFTPAEPLATDAEYELLITQEIEDLDGDALMSELSVTFMTDMADSQSDIVLSMDYGDGQAGNAFEALQVQLGVTVKDRRGNGLTEWVTWKVAPGEGEFVPWAGADVAGPTITVRSSDAGGSSRVTFRPLTTGTVSVTAEVAGAEGSPVTFTTDVPCWTDVGVASVRLYEENGFVDTGIYHDPSYGLRHHKGGNFTVPLGTTVEWNYRHLDNPAATSRVLSTAAPPGGQPFDSGVLQSGDAFQFLPSVEGIWEYDWETNQFGTTSAQLTVVGVPSGPKCDDTSSTAQVYDRESPHTIPAGALSRYVLYKDGRFELQYSTDSWGDFAYTGRYSRTGSVITFNFDAWSAAGPWEATGTIDGIRLVVEYNVVMGLSDFENGVYVLNSSDDESP